MQGAALRGEPVGNPAEIIGMWRMFLSEMTDESLGVATLMYIKQPCEGQKFWPQPHQLVAMVTPQKLDADGAAGAALKLIGRFNRYKLPGPDDALDDDPDVDSAMKAGLAALGGFLALCDSEGDGWRHPFRRAYDAEMSRRTQANTARRSVEAIAGRRQIAASK